MRRLRRLWGDRAGGKAPHIEFGGFTLALFDAVNKPNAFPGVQVCQHLHGLVPAAVHIPADLLHGIVDIHAPVLVVPAVLHGQAHPVQQHTIQQFGVCGQVLETGVCDKLAGDAEIDKLFRFIAVKIFRYCGLWHGRLLLLGKEKSTIVKSCFFLNVQFCHKSLVLR